MASRSPKGKKKARGRRKKRGGADCRVLFLGGKKKTTTRSRCLGLLPRKKLIKIFGEKGGGGREFPGSVLPGKNEKSRLGG